MPVHNTVAGSRLFVVANDLYGRLDDDTYQAVVIENGDIWDGQGALQGGQRFTVPDTPPTINYNEGDLSAAERASVAQLERPTRAARAPVGETRNMSGRTGAFIDETAAVRQDVYYRVLTYRGTREWRLSYSTRIEDAMTYNFSEELGNEAVAVARESLAPAANRYSVVSITYAFDYDSRTLTLYIRVAPLFSASSVVVEIPLPVIDLS